MNRLTAILTALIVLAGGLAALHGATAASKSEADRIQPERNIKRVPGLKPADCARHFSGGRGQFKLGQKTAKRTDVESYLCSFSVQIVCAPGMTADKPVMKQHYDGRISIRYRCTKQPQ